MKKIVQYLVTSLIVFNTFLSTWWLINNDILYEVDVSRDFSLLKEMIDTGRLSLVGPHTSMGGVFHGPLWYYINLPVFFATGGDPILMGWFWWGLSIATLIIFWIVVKKLFGSTVALFSTLLYSANSIVNPIIGFKQFFNPYGAVMLSPVFFYFLVRYIETKKSLFLAFLLLTIGCLIQFQMVFGIPILILTILYLAIFLYKNKLLKHLLIFPIILFPLLTFILFDLRHDFIQTKSALMFLSSSQQKNIEILPFVYEKAVSVVTDTFFSLTLDNRLLAGVYFLLFIFLAFKVKGKDRKIYMFFLYFYFGFWLMLLPQNITWTTYYWPFLPIIIMLITAFMNHLSKEIFFLIFIPLLIWNYYIAGVYINKFNFDIDKRGTNSWAFNKKMAEMVYEDAKGDFGYYIYTPYLWVYNQWYALSFVQKEYPKITSHPFTKKNLTYLIMVNNINKESFNTDSNGWKITHIKITKELESIQQFGQVNIHKYSLTDEEIKIPANPYLLNSTFFR